MYAWLGVFPVMGYPKSSKKSSNFSIETHWFLVLKPIDGVTNGVLVLKPIGLIPHFESLMYTFHFESQRSRGVHHSPDGWVFQVAQSFGLLHGAKIHTRLGHMVDQPKWWMIIFNKCRRGGDCCMARVYLKLSLSFYCLLVTSSLPGVYWFDPQDESCSVHLGIFFPHKPSSINSIMTSAVTLSPDDAYKWESPIWLSLSPFWYPNPNHHLQSQCRLVLPGD